MKKINSLALSNLKEVTSMKKIDVLDNVYSVYNFNSMTNQELLNQFFNKLNDVINLSNETIILTEYLVNEGLGFEVNLKLNEWKENGTLNEVINVDLFNGLNDKINNIETSIKSNNIDDSKQLQYLLDSGVKNITLDSNIILKNSVIIPSNVEIKCKNGVEIICDCETVFILEKGTNNVTFSNLEMINKNITNKYCIDVRGGELDGLSDSIRKLIIKDSRFTGFNTCFNIKKIRQSLFDNISVYCSKCINYFDKSAELNIINSFFVQHGTFEGSYGIKSYSIGDKYPEGLTVTNTLFYNFKNNLIINDLYVGNFNSCHIDSSVEGSEGNIISYNKKCEQISFDSCWMLNKGFEIGDSNSTNSQSFKMKISNCKFDHMSGNPINLKKFASDIIMENNNMIGNGGELTKIGLVCDNLNNNIVYNNNNHKFMQRVFVLNGVGSNNILLNNSHDIDSGEIAFSNYIVETDILFDNNKIDISDSTNFNHGSYLFNNNIQIQKGLYLATINLNEINVQQKGYLNLEGDSNFTVINGLVGMDVSEKNINASVVIKVNNTSTSNLRLKVESGSLVTGYLGSVTLVKI